MTNYFVKILIVSKAIIFILKAKINTGDSTTSLCSAVMVVGFIGSNICSSIRFNWVVQLESPPVLFAYLLFYLKILYVLLF